MIKGAGEMHDNSKVLLIGSGGMACEYLKVLESLGKSVVIVGRGNKNLEYLKNLYPDYEYCHGGLDKFLQSNPTIPEFVINAVNVEYLGVTSCKLLEYGAKYLLIEKPGDLTEQGLQKICDLAKAKEAIVCVAYNRRFYTSVRDMIAETTKDGGITSLNFEFTEWTHTFGPETHSLVALNNWILSNSSHVIDTAFYLIGEPKYLASNVSGANVIKWHRSGSIFVGSGMSVRGIPFSYHSNWNGPGRWAIEVITAKRRFYLKPMEKLFKQELATVSVNEIMINDELDINYKPGLYLQTNAFLDLNLKKLQLIDDQLRAMRYYREIAGY
jgi:predicted dehydrogenase